ncbi:MAG: GTP diphosphokinase [Gammaproteobacteria bacterium]|nr:GTP diphosphokinase [Gammaproteobacteria bacterium]
MVSVTDKNTGISSKEAINLDAWLDSLAASRTPQEMKIIERTCRLVEQAYVSGAPGVQHAVATASILAALNMDHEAIVAALLHNAVEDAVVSLVQVESQFGATVASLVDGAARMDDIRLFQSLPERHKKERHQTEALRKMLLAMVEDVRIVLIKLADRIHNMRTLGALPEDERQRIARETLDVYAPLANRLGMWQLKWELEDLSLRYLEPVTYKQIAAMVSERRIDREQYITRFVATLKTELAKTGIEAEVKGRPKHIYSIWRKMQRKHLDYSQVYDVRAVRVLVNSIAECYAALGIVHALWPYIPGQFDDYIATPKENNYRSIHTAIIGPEGKTVEVQIRTHDMHQHAELGVAAHWRYKEGAAADAGFDRKVNLLRELLEWKRDIEEAGEAGETVRADIFEDRVYVFTPKGNIVDLPVGATPLDFAYQIHTDLGHRCRGAKVNGQMVPLTYRLQSGEQVEILSVKRGDPSRDWLNVHLGYLKTARARSKVQYWFRQQRHEENIDAGRAALEREFQRLGLTGISHETLAQRLGYSKTDDFLAALGRHDIKTAQIIHAIEDILRSKKAAEEPALPVHAPAPKPVGGGDVQILGVGNLLTQMAGCCKPVPGEPVAGFITRGRGVTIHRRDCRNLLRLSEAAPQRVVQVDWGKTTHATYPVDIHITAFDRQGLLRDISAVLANEEINVIAVNTLSNKKNHTARMTITVEISDLESLSRVLAKIGQLPNVHEVWRQGR